MRSNNAMRLALAVILAFTATVWIACDNANTGGSTSAPPRQRQGSHHHQVGRARKKSSCKDATSSEKLLAQDSLQHFDKAIALDPDFAIGRVSPRQ